ncbi:hypothetical protein ACW9YQ_34190 (plasmid) [Paraburkholderia strydomiana]|uniref:hypothetical protein n=1 Tax=Paraburkholderia sp. RCC_158 TaxID=3239220 RepID=UPI0035268A3E
MKKPHPKVRPDWFLACQAGSNTRLTRDARMLTLGVLAAVVLRKDAQAKESQRNTKSEETETHAHAPFMETMPS